MPQRSLSQSRKSRIGEPLPDHTLERFARQLRARWSLRQRLSAWQAPSPPYGTSVTVATTADLTCGAAPIYAVMPMTATSGASISRSRLQPADGRQTAACRRLRLPDGGRLRSTLTASNAGEDDHLGAGNALTGVALALSRDGRTLAVAAPHEDSDARGVNGNQAERFRIRFGRRLCVHAERDRAGSSRPTSKRRTRASGDQFGFAVALSADGNTLAVACEFRG